MMSKEFFPQRPELHPMIYAYTDSNPQYKGLLKVGYTEKDVEKRVGQQYPTKRPDGLCPIKSSWPSRPCATTAPALPTMMFTMCCARKEVHKSAANGFDATRRSKSGHCRDQNGHIQYRKPHSDLCHAPEQKEAVDKTIEYFAPQKGLS